jgi:hypothetical protein
MKSYRHTVMLLIREIECRMFDIDPKSLENTDNKDAGLKLLHTAYDALWKYHNMQEELKMERWKKYRVWE